jgi:hypothetical protein
MYAGCGTIGCVQLLPRYTSARSAHRIRQRTCFGLGYLYSTLRHGVFVDDWYARTVDFMNLRNSFILAKRPNEAFSVFIYNPRLRISATCPLVRWRNIRYDRLLEQQRDTLVMKPVGEDAEVIVRFSRLAPITNGRCCREYTRGVFILFRSVTAINSSDMRVKGALPQDSRQHLRIECVYLRCKSRGETASGISISW